MGRICCLMTALSDSSVTVPHPYRATGFTLPCLSAVPWRGMENRRSRQLVCLQGVFAVAVGFHTHLAADTILRTVSPRDIQLNKL